MENNPVLIAFFFQPFAIGTIFNLSAQALKTQSVELNCWDPQKSMAVNLQLFHSSSVKEKIEILEYFIGTQIEANRKHVEIIQHATDTFMQHSNPEVISLILKELKLPERTFQRIFKKYVGITANEYRRLCQFYFAFSQLKGGHFEKLTDVAYANNYFDQSHFIRSFKEFTDITPVDYQKFGLKEKNK